VTNRPETRHAKSDGIHIARRVAGIAVHIGARIAALAEPRVVLASGTARDPVAGSGTEFEDRGSHELRGVPGEWRLFAVREP
jgi:class 3 adenylate cyclase